MRDTVAVLSSKRMGEGDEKLGELLMKSFIFALKEHKEELSAVLFYNGGALLAAEGSEALEDLRELSEAGVELLICGTCADYFGIKEKLAVGRITNMFDITSRMQKAAHVLRP